MTIQEIKSLTDFQLNVHVADISGWKRVPATWPSKWFGFKHFFYHEKFAPKGDRVSLENYCNDIHLMRNAAIYYINTYKNYEGRALEMAENLSIVCDAKHELLTVFASPRQYAEAFVLTFGKTT